MSRMVDWWISRFFPQHCSGCAKVIDYREWWCEDCLQDLPVIEPPICPHCGVSKTVCFCEQQHHAYDRCCAPFYNEGVAGKAIRRYKYAYLKPIAKALAPYVAAVVRREYAEAMPQMITFVPLHKSDAKLRDFNPGETIAREVAALLDIPCVPLLIKRYQTEPQKNLSALRRSGNLLGAFDVLPDVSIKGRSILLIDDVLTTGATLDECAKMLKIFGAQTVLAATAVITTYEE